MCICVHACVYVARTWAYLLGGLVHPAEHHEEEAALDVHVPEDIGGDAVAGCVCGCIEVVG